MFGLKINFAKSEDIIINGDEEKCLQYTFLFNCQVGCFAIKYLGVPVSPSRLHACDWEPLVEKNEKKLSTWERQLTINCWENYVDLLQLVQLFYLPHVNLVSPKNSSYQAGQTKKRFLLTRGWD